MGVLDSENRFHRDIFHLLIHLNSYLFVFLYVLSLGSECDLGFALVIVSVVHETTVFQDL